MSLRRTVVAGVAVAVAALTLSSTTTTIVTQVAASTGGPPCLPTGIRSFESSWYLSSNPDIRPNWSGSKDLIWEHFARIGSSEGRLGRPGGCAGGRNPLCRGFVNFDAQFYFSHHPDLRLLYNDDEGVALGHYLSWGRAEYRQPCPGCCPGIDVCVKGAVDPAYYLRRYPDLVDAQGQPISSAAATTHYKDVGRAEMRTPCANCCPGDAVPRTEVKGFGMKCERYRCPEPLVQDTKVLSKMCEAAICTDFECCFQAAGTSATPLAPPLTCERHTCTQSRRISVRGLDCSASGGAAADDTDAAPAQCSDQFCCVPTFSVDPNTCEAWRCSPQRQRVNGAPELVDCPNCAVNPSAPTICCVDTVGTMIDTSCGRDRFRYCADGRAVAPSPTAQCSLQCPTATRNSNGDVICMSDERQCPIQPPARRHNDVGCHFSPCSLAQGGYYSADEATREKNAEGFKWLSLEMIIVWVVLFVICLLTCCCVKCARDRNNQDKAHAQYQYDRMGVLNQNSPYHHNPAQFATGNLSSPNSGAYSGVQKEIRI